MKVQEILPDQLDEGFGDYAKGALGHFGRDVAQRMAAKGRQIAEPFVKAHEAGRRASQEGSERKARQREFNQNRKAFIRASEQLPGVIAQLGKVSVKLRQVKSQLKTIPTNEGLWDYLRGAAGTAGQSAGKVGGAIKGAAQQVGGAVGGAAKKMHHAGQRSSLTAQQQKLTQQQLQLAQQLVQLAKVRKLSKDQVIQLINKQLGVTTAAAAGARVAFVTVYNQQNPASQQSQQPPAPTAPPSGQQWTRDNMTLEPRE